MLRVSWAGVKMKVLAYEQERDRAVPEGVVDSEAACGMPKGIP